MNAHEILVLEHNQDKIDSKCGVTKSAAKLLKKT